MVTIAKTDLTIELEGKLRKSTRKIGVFGCFEVTIGFGGNERVDYITYDSKGIWRCYEIKTSKADFYSNAAKTFIGHYNYYVMPEWLYEEVKGSIPKHIGVHNGRSCIKNAKKQPLGTDEQVLKDSMIRSLSREQDKLFKTCDTSYLNKLQRQINIYKNNARISNNRTISYRNVIHDICDKYNLDYKEVRELVRRYD